MDVGTGFYHPPMLSRLFTRPRSIQFRRIDCPSFPRRLVKMQRDCGFRWPLPSHMLNDGSWLVEARLGRRVVGYSWVIYRDQLDREGERVVYLEEVAVVEARRNSGIGTNLVRESCRWTRELGFTEVYAHPQPGEGESGRQRWLARLGFAPGDFEMHVLKLNPPSGEDSNREPA
ncbi:MAG TPA: GNAT family N-acetyltransferase [Actinomycetota bacterium]|nr:GNAT family N-acetyltransferase [Actinomycetota bacterium]